MESHQLDTSKDEDIDQIWPNLAKHGQHSKPSFSVSTITRELRATCRSDRDQQCFNGDSDSENPSPCRLDVHVWFHALTTPFTILNSNLKVKTNENYMQAALESMETYET